MNINTLSEIIDLFNEEIVSSGFQRDIQDNINSWTSNQNNIAVLREIADKINNKLNSLYGGDLPENLKKLLPAKVKPFTESNFNGELQTLINDKEIQLANFAQKLNQILSNLNAQIQQNIAEIKKIKTFIDPYIENQIESENKEHKAIISIIFKDTKTISSLKEFSKTIQSWNKILPLYQQLLKSSSPEDIEIITVQNGSIDFLINVDFDIALNLTELFKIGFKCFLAYLSYKKMAKPIIETYCGNKKLIEGEKDRENELINNIGEAIKNKILEQNKKALEQDTQIDGNSDKKVEQVVKLVTSHILKGNDLKLLSLPAPTKDDTDMENEKTLRTISTEVRQAMKVLPPAEIKMLQEKYTAPEE